MSTTFAMLGPSRAPLFTRFLLYYWVVGSWKSRHCSLWLLPVDTEASSLETQGSWSVGACSEPQAVSFHAYAWGPSEDREV